ncbi:MAG: hypothetical protein IJV39_05460 [Ruminococcus sp.]|nr:hypothetical protein [Ruminococcus sp.]
MKKLITATILLIMCTVIFTGCNSEEILDGYKEGNSYTDDDQDYGKYVYDSSYDKKFADDKNYKEVTDADIENINGYINDFYEWAKISNFSSEYKVDENTVSAGDYYLIKDDLVDDSGTGLRKVTKIYRKYTIYYYDTDTHTLHYIHNDLTM